MGWSLENSLSSGSLDVFIFWKSYLYITRLRGIFWECETCKCIVTLPVACELETDLLYIGGAGKGDREHLELPEAHALLGSLLGMRSGPNPYPSLNPPPPPLPPPPSPQACRVTSQRQLLMNISDEEQLHVTQRFIVWFDFCCPPTFTTLTVKCLG